MKKIHLKRKKTLEDRITDEIDAEVKEMKREWRHFVKFKDENYLLFTAFILILAAALIINTVYVINRNGGVHSAKSSKTIIVANPAKVLTSLQTATTDSTTIKISNVTETDKLDRAFGIEDGETMLIFNITISNNTAEKQQLIPVNQFYVRSDEGDYATLHPSSSVTAPLAAAEIAPGKSATGQLSFAVPKHISHPLLYIDTGWNKNVPIVYDVLH